MSGTLTQVWQYLGDELWLPLASHEDAPYGLFSDLFAIAGDRLSPRPAESELELALSDPSAARDSFLSLSGTDFTNELELVWFFDDARKLIADYEVPSLASFYLTRLGSVVRKFNLRYRTDEALTLRFLMQGSFANLYSELQRINVGNAGLEELLSEFEEIFDDYVRTPSISRLKSIIAKASNYAEGLASATRGNGTGGTLGSLAKTLGRAPHEELEKALLSVYRFCCDYPGIRHGGTPGSARRSLEAPDGVVAALLLFSFTAYLTPEIHSNALYGSVVL